MPSSSTSNKSEWIPRAEIRADLLVEPIIVKEGVELTKDGIGMLGKFRHTSEDIFVRIAIDEHGSTNSTGTREIISFILAWCAIHPYPIFPLFRNSNEY